MKAFIPKKENLPPDFFEKLEKFLKNKISDTERQNIISWNESDSYAGVIVNPEAQRSYRFMPSASEVDCAITF